MVHDTNSFSLTSFRVAYLMKSFCNNLIQILRGWTKLFFPALGPKYTNGSSSSAWLLTRRHEKLDLDPHQIYV